MVRAHLREDDFKECEAKQYNEGDVVLRLLTDYEREHYGSIESSVAMRFVPKWSSPAKIIKLIGGKAALVCGLWDGEYVEPVQVPMRNLKRFEVEVPQPLRQEMFKSIQHERPQMKRLSPTAWQQYGESTSVFPSIDEAKILSEGRRTAKAADWKRWVLHPRS